MIRKTLTILSLIGLLLSVGLLAGTSYKPLLSITFGTLIASVLTLVALLTSKLVGKLRQARDRRIILPAVVVTVIIAVLAAFWVSTQAVAMYRWHHPLANRQAKRAWLKDLHARLAEGDVALLHDTWDEQFSWLCPQPQKNGIRAILVSMIETPTELNLPEFRSIEYDTDYYFTWPDWLNDNWEIISPWIEHHLDELRFDPSSRNYKLDQSQ